MMETTLHIKNMVCNRCILVVEQLLERLDIPYENVVLGKVNISSGAFDDNKLRIISEELKKLGFELIDSHKGKLIEKIKKTVINKIHYGELDDNNLSWSGIISEELNYDYNYLSRLFSSTESITIEHYIINQKIEKAKELIVYDELSLSQIADKLGYSSVAHLSGQFKKVTGMTPSDFKKLGNSLRKPLDEV